MLNENLVKYSIISAILSGVAISPAIAKTFVESSAPYSYHMLDPTTDITQKQRFLFNSKDDYLTTGSLNLGASFIGIMDFQTSNRDSKFGYLMRHPTQANQRGRDVSEVSVHSVQVQASGALNSWITVYNELLYNPQQSFGAGTITSLTRNQIQVRKAYVLLGDKEISPVYAAFGKQDLPFGFMDTVNPFSASSIWHAFGGLAYSAILGVDYDGINVAVAAVQGGAQFRAANTPVKATNVPSSLNNYVVDGNYTYSFNANNTLMVGASFIKGSAYNQNFPVTHFGAGDKHNPAWDAYTKLVVNNFTAFAEFARTTRVWPGTFNPSPPLNIHPASRVTSFGLGGSYNFKEMICDYDLKLSLEYTEFQPGPIHSPWRRQSQTVAGLSLMVKENIKFFLEGVHVKGYVPLNNISGNLNGVPGTTHSDRGGKTNVFLLGLQASL